ncbi:MAG TPA: penicillin-binding transpeptidase domain-containing protein [Methylomirabilota bacterium]|nr:penicillin-binding transpeptidase domain-containing protein [Methylomirabilota bacterium]
MSGRGLQTRVLILAALLGAAFAGLGGRLAWLQLVRHAELSALADRQYSRTLVLQAQRGPIVDRHGSPLATSSPAESLFAQPRAVGDPVRVAARLAPLLRVPEAELHALLTSSRSWLWLRRRLPPAMAAEVKALREPGLGLLPEPLRLYPNRELAAHVLGFEGDDGGLEGVERAWQDTLAGTPGKAVVGRDALGREVVTERVLVEPAPGHGLMLTVDRTIQYLAERELDAAWRRTRARAATAVVLDPRNGDVLALAVRPTFNPNAFLDVPSREHWRNRAVTDPFEPGSTFKVILAAAALEEGVVRPDDRIYAENGAITIARTTIHDWKRYGWLTFAEVLQNSSNVGSIKVGLALGRERYHRYMTAFGFGSLTGLGLAGESRGVLRDPARWSALSLPTMSLGQEVSVTALQMVAAFGAVANGGTLMQPRLVKSVFDADGRERSRFEPRAVRQVISAETARTLTRMLVRVVESGTGHNAAIAGYEVAGKTGTAQKLDPATKRYSRNPGVLSFVGFVPADEPKLVMLVMLDEPKNEKWGSEAAAPIFSAIGGEVLRYLDVAPRDAAPLHIVAGPAEGPPARVRLSTAAAEPAAGRTMPELRGRTLREALAALAPLGAAVKVQGRGLVKDQTPAPGEAVESEAVVRLTLAGAVAR